MSSMCLRSEWVLSEHTFRPAVSGLIHLQGFLLAETFHILAASVMTLSLTVILLGSMCTGLGTCCLAAQELRQTGIRTMFTADEDLMSTRFCLDNMSDHVKHFTSVCTNAFLHVAPRVDSHCRLPLPTVLVHG